jgi:RNA polymerase sigma factor (sigma-70 family)
MNETRQSLLLRAQTGEADAWKDLADLYRPLILGWLNRQGVPAVDLEDLSQDVLLTVVKHLPSFEHSGHRGAFRSWLRTIVCSRTTDYWRATGASAPASGGSGATAALQQIADPGSDLNRQWDEEHDRYVLGCLLDAVDQPDRSASTRPTEPGHSSFPSDLDEGIDAERKSRDTIDGNHLVAGHSVVLDLRRLRVVPAVPRIADGVNGEE